MSRKVLLCGLTVLLILFGLPVMATVMMTMQRAAATCTATLPAGLGDLGVIDGLVGGPVEGTLTLATANIPNRSQLSGFRASMPRVLSTRPDFVTLNEVSDRSIAEMEAAAAGYSAHREPAPTTGVDAAQALGNAVLWRTEDWTRAAGGLVQLVEDDRTFYAGRPGTWDRFATWVMLQRRTDGADAAEDNDVVAVVSTHHMVNPHKHPRQHGNPPLTRPEQYSAGMDILLRLIASLSAHGPVLVGGDMNTPATYTDTNLAWAAAPKMRTAGYGWHTHGVDYVFYPHVLGVRLIRGWTGTMVSDHQWVSARLAMNGAGPSLTSTAATTEGGGGEAALSDDVLLAELMRSRLTPMGPTLTIKQAQNAVTIARIAQDLGVPRFGLQVALAAAIQESTLRNLDYGDRDSLGLFQQRPSTGWGTPAQITDPVLAAQAFFGRAAHTHNTGLLHIPGWEDMPLTMAAQAVQRSAHPGAYARWEAVAGVLTTLLTTALPLAHTVGWDGEHCPDPAVTTGVPGCPGAAAAYDLGPVQPQLADLVAVLAPMFGIQTVGGYRESARDPGGHPAGLAADFMTTSRAQGDALAAYGQAHASALGIDYIIWWQRIWSLDRAAEGWRPMEDRGSETANHRDHVHFNQRPDGVVDPDFFHISCATAA